MLIQCLGCGDAFGSGGRMNSCFYIESESVIFLIDCGASALISLKKHGITGNAIDMILISHLHGDHFGGIPFMIRETGVSVVRKKPLVIIGPKGIERSICDSLDCFFPSGSTRLTFTLTFIEYTADEMFTWNNIKVHPYKAVHTEGTNPHSLRIKIRDKIIAYSGDTEWNSNIPLLSKDADIFICEAFSMVAKKNHMSVKDLVEHRNEIDAKRIVLTHAGTDVLDNENSIPFPLASDGEILLNSN